MSDKLALVFPGQGSQYVGMGLDLYEQYPAARAVYEQADQILGMALSALCFEGPESDLNDTINTQVAVLSTSLATLKALGGVERIEDVDLVAGHSLGEYTALVAAGAVSFVEALQLVRERGRLMKEAGERRPGGMAAVLGVPSEVVSQACDQAHQETGAIVQVANYNLPEQIVISGEHQGLQRASEIVKEKGARRVVSLAVSIASHSPLMESAAQGLKHALEKVSLSSSRIPVVGNVSALPLTEAREIGDELIRQLVSPVQWVDSVRFMLDQGINTFVEVGPKDVLTKLIRRIAGEARAVSVSDAAAVEGWRSGTLRGADAGEA